MLGTTLGSYRLERTLGAGGMGVVYLGMHTLLGRPAAVKVLLPKYSQDPEIVQRFFNEARAATAIKHPGIVEIYDFGYEANGCAFIVMERCEGESLAARIRRHPMPYPRAIEISRHIAAALAAAHKAGIIHRDLKPDNVFVVPDPEVAGGERIKLLDFGIAKLASDHAPGPSQTTTGALMGTPNYMSPEQCRGAGKVDERTDLYSLGCILFQLVCRRVPFVGEGVGDIISAHLQAPPPMPSELAPDLPPDLERLILQLLAKKAADRPPSAEAVSAELQRIASTLPDTLVAEPPPPVGLAATLPPVDPAGATVPSEPPQAPAPATRRPGFVLVTACALVVALVVVLVVQVVSTRSEDELRTAPVDAAVALPDAPLPPTLVIGPLGGSEMTDTLRTRLRPLLARSVSQRLPGVRVVLDKVPARELGPRTAYLDGRLERLVLVDKDLQCEFRPVLLSHPDKTELASLSSSAKLSMQSTTIKELEQAAAECVDALVEDQLSRTFLPWIQRTLDLKPTDTP